MHTMKVNGLDFLSMDKKHLKYLIYVPQKNESHSGSEQQEGKSEMPEL